MHEKLQVWYLILTCENKDPVIHNSKASHAIHQNVRAGVDRMRLNMKANSVQALESIDNSPTNGIEAWRATIRNCCFVGSGTLFTVLTGASDGGRARSSSRVRWTWRFCNLRRFGWTRGHAFLSPPTEDENKRREHLSWLAGFRIIIFYCDFV